MNFVSEQNTAILLFARSVNAEMQYKQLAGNVPDNRLLLDALKRNATQIAEQATLPMFHFSEADQVGNTFGERITNSISSIFQKGYGQVIVMGSDCPDISVYDIRTAESILSEGKMAVGPDQRGGTFLLGLTSEMFNAEVLAGLDWQTSDLLESIESFASATAHEVVYLNQKFDLNNSDDLSEFACKSQFLTKILTQIFDTPFQWNIVCVINTYLSYSNNHLRRGPPVPRTTY